MRKKPFLTLTKKQERVLAEVIKIEPGKKLSVREIADTAEVNYTTASTFIRRLGIEGYIRITRTSKRNEMLLRIPERSNIDITYLLWWAPLTIGYSLNSLELDILLKSESEDPEEIARELGRKENQVAAAKNSILVKRGASLGQARIEIRRAKEELQKKLAAV
ncbi:MAG: hypothetical protein ABH813_01010 [Patescibacteria group bacterium]